MPFSRTSIALALLKAMDAGRHAIDLLLQAERRRCTHRHACRRFPGILPCRAAGRRRCRAVGEIADQAQRCDRYGKVLQDGADAPNEIKQAFDALGISMADVQKHGDDLDWMLAAMAEGFAGVKTQAERTTIAKALFGREGAKLLPLLGQGAEALRAEQRAARDAGAVLSDDLVEAYDTLGDRLDAAGKQLEVQKARIFPEAAVRYGEAVAGAAKTFADFLDDVRQDLGPERVRRHRPCRRHREPAERAVDPAVEHHQGHYQRCPRSAGCDRFLGRRRDRRMERHHRRMGTRCFAAEADGAFERAHAARRWSGWLAG